MGATEQATKIVVGLGNPGRRYAQTRHNVGFEVVEALRRRWKLDNGRKAFGGVVTEARNVPGADRVLLLEPHTFMNLSGTAVIELATFYKAPPDDVLVVLDDLALPLGRLRARADGSAGGHKGLSDVIRALGTDRVARLRIGIGPQPPMMDSVDFVLQGFTEPEWVELQIAVNVAAEAVENWVRDGIIRVMDKYNRKAEKPE